MTTSRDSTLLGDPDREAQVYGTGACPYTGRARRLLREQGLDHVYIDLDEPQHRRLEALLQTHTGQRTVPWVFVRGRFVGGYDELDQEARLGQLGTSPADRVAVLAPPSETPTRPGREVELGEALAASSGRKRPSRPETHQLVDPMKLMELGLTVEGETEGEPLTLALIEEVAGDEGAPLQLVMAGVALMDELELERESDVCFRVCTGRCQSWGALDRLEHLLSLRQDDRGDGKPSFDIEPVECLDRCDRAPAVVVVTEDGIAGLDAARDEDLSAAVEQLCEG
ncbi:glutaredoxin 3 [Enhygromyxa salina]|uniref:Glutaredoxin 3 n=1 Tax=Enhygromyxa salina TaxID=215803 RepID=A0A2S9XGR8_9BACT|nr:glutaredoxin domain-containing protein [Enhygromyxa salina]PRP92074.1 glutaredoxin 3 [Enhygromyxa salina]